MDQVDWRNIRLRPGDWSCPVHGVIEPAHGGLVPHCTGLVGGRRCMRIAWQATAIGDKVVAVEPRPRTCGKGHRLGPRTVRLGWQPCPCTPARGHRVWSCVACGDEQRWPPHDEAVPLPR